MLLREVEYARPKSVEEAIGLLSSHEGARALAGGQTLVNVMKARAASPDVLVDLQDLDELRGVRDLGSGSVEILRLDGDDDELRVFDGFLVRRRRRDAVAFRELMQPLLAPTGDDDLAGLAPRGREETGEQRLADLAASEDRDLALVHGSECTAPFPPSGSCRSVPS